MQLDEELVDRYERKIRKGFPVGEVQSELIDKGYSEKDAAQFMQALYSLSAKKNITRGKAFRIIIAAIILGLGIVALNMGSLKLGGSMLFSGIIKIGYDLFHPLQQKEQESH